MEDAHRRKSGQELVAQAGMLARALKVCSEKGTVANLHDHTFEVNDGMHDLKSTRSRIPDFKLGPDLNWLIRGGVDPVDFIREYGKQIVCLHIRDQTASSRWTDAVGEGATDFPAIAQVLRCAFQRQCGDRTGVRKGTCATSARKLEEESAVCGNKFWMVKTARNT
ncbi:MAG: hypothetical protein INR69_02880 [Mucilaginibacter polytrichastri]|nr:hypothetical protein [Mucilaginibacter polytrichastri]